MKATRILALGGAAMLALAVVGPVAAQDESPAAASKDPGAAAGAKLFVNMKGPSAGNPFWALVEQGAVQAGADYGVDVQVVAPSAESDIPGQIALIEDNTAQGAAGMAIAVTDAVALNPAIQAAMDAGVKVVWVDSGGDNEGVTYIGTDNAVGAALAGQYLCDNLEPGSKVAILQGLITTTTGQARADGSKAAVEACGLDLVMEVPADWDRAKGLAATEDIITQHPDLAGIFGSNDEMALGAVEALRAAEPARAGHGRGLRRQPGCPRRPSWPARWRPPSPRTPSTWATSAWRASSSSSTARPSSPTIDTGVELITAENAAG